MTIDVVAFDGDDTLWHNETIFSMTQERFEALLEPYVEPKHLHERMLATERRNVSMFGYGIKGYRSRTSASSIRPRPARI